jgi:hypothetical protein
VNSDGRFDGVLSLRVRFLKPIDIRARHLYKSSPVHEYTGKIRKEFRLDSQDRTFL